MTYIVTVLETRKEEYTRIYKIEADNKTDAADRAEACLGELIATVSQEHYIDVATLGVEEIE